MPRKERYQEAGHYHIINRGVERRAIYLEQKKGCQTPEQKKGCQTPF